MVLVILCVVLAVLTIGFALVVRDKDVPPVEKENPELKHLQERRATLFENLKDLQFEYLQGKLSDEDYQSLKLGFQNDLAVVLASIDLQKKNSPVQPADDGQEKASEHSSQGGKGEKSGPLICSACHAESASGQRFCGSCGAQL